METIEAQIVVANDLQARRISAAENLQREDLSAIEAIETIVEIVDAELIGDKEYTHLSKTYLWEKDIKTSLGQPGLNVGIEFLNFIKYYIVCGNFLNISLDCFRHFPYRFSIS